MDNFIPVSYSNLRKANKIVNLALRGRPRSDFSFLRNDGHRQRDIFASALLQKPPRRFFKQALPQLSTQDPILHAKAVVWGIGLPNAAFTTARNPRKELQIEAAHRTCAARIARNTPPPSSRRTTAQNGCFRLLETQCGQLVRIQ
ncbi:uncharacterized protein LOC125477648 isoform X2 [Pyrus x bretschneideri]|uniref:uncharacterized protein LOC125477648 isoform X2 n=1 Tax=Pyrus x bretschneideri TaxID=225117 RepID=UPI00202FDC2A|nr:uncharacterized protein LOC125477648 isoform X2 [Pyrus x bretschneideri]